MKKTFILSLIIVLLLFFVSIISGVESELYEEYTATGNNLVAIDKERYSGQGFTVGNTGDNVTHYITSVKLRLRRVNTPGLFITSIRATDGAGEPTGADLTNVTLDGNTTLGTTVVWVEINFTTPYMLIKGTTYAIVVGAPDCPSGSLVEWSRATSGGYGGGLWCYSTDYGVTWGNNPARDYQFKTYGYPVSAVLPVISNEYPTDDATLWECPSATINATITDIDGTFNWSIETSPDVGNSSSTGASNGSKTCSLTDMLYSTTYTWYINTTDNTLMWNNASYNFTTRDAKLRENSALSWVEQAIVGVVGIIILLGFLYAILKMDFKKEGALAKLLLGLLIAMALFTVIYSLL